MQNKGSLRRDWAWTFITEISAKLAPFATIIVCYLILSSEMAGSVVVGYSYTMLAWVFVDLGMGLYGTREVARANRDSDTLLYEITIGRILLAAPVSLLLIAALQRLELLSSIEIAAYIVFLFGRSLSCDWLYRGQGRFRELSKCTQIGLIGHLLALLILLEGNHLSGMSSLPFAATGLMMAISTWTFSGVRLQSFQWGFTRTALSHLRGSYILTLAKAASAITQQLPILALSIVFPVSAYSGFALLHRVVLSSTLVFVSLGTAVFPRFVQKAKEDYHEAWKSGRKVIFYIVVMVLPVSALLFLATQVPQIHSKFFPDVTWLTSLAMLSYLAIRSARIVPMRFLVASDRQKKALYASASGCVLFSCILLVLWLARGLTVEQVALSFVMTEAVIFAVMLHFCRKGQ